MWKRRKSNLVPFFYDGRKCRRQCKRDWPNVRLYLFFNVRKFRKVRTPCAMAFYSYFYVFICIVFVGGEGGVSDKTQSLFMLTAQSALIIIKNKSNSKHKLLLWSTQTSYTWVFWETFFSRTQRRKIKQNEVLALLHAFNHKSSTADSFSWWHYSLLFSGGN